MIFSSSIRMQLLSFPPLTKPACCSCLDVPEKAKSPGRRDLFLEPGGTFKSVGVLGTHRLRVIQNIANRKNVRRLDADRFALAAIYPIRPVDDDLRPWLAFLPASFLDEVTELDGGTIQNGDLSLNLTSRLVML